MPSTTTDRLSGLTTSVAVKAPVKVATTANITLSGTQTIDGIAVVADDRVLVKNQTSGAQNGIYKVSASAWSRAGDFDGNRDVVRGSLIFVNQGSTNGGLFFSVNTVDPITIGTTSLTITAVTAPQATGNLTVSGDLTVTGTSQLGDGAADTVSVVGQQMYIYNSGFGTADYERLGLTWATNVATILTELGGTGTARDLKLQSAAAKDIFLAPGGSTNRWRFDGVTFELAPVANNAVDLGTTTEQIRRAYLGTQIFLGDTANTKQTYGITLNQDTVGDEIFALKANNINHQMTDETETDTFLTITRATSLTGGATLRGFSGHTWAMILEGCVFNNDAAKTSGADAPLRFIGSLKSGSGIGALASTDNLMVIRNRLTNKFIFDGGARLYFLGAASTDIVGNGKWAINDDADANLTLGLIINQGANDDEILAFKSSDIAHGITDAAETDTYAFFRKATAANGGLEFFGLTEGSIAVNLRGLATTAVTGARTTGSNAAVIIDGALKSGTGQASMGADANLLAVRDFTTTRFVLDSDGDSHQDVGTAWTNFDTHDDLQVLDAVAVSLAREGDPLREDFIRYFEQNRALIESLPGKRLVSFNDDGHHFMNMSRLTMLHTGAIRQLGQRLQALERRALEHHV